MKLFRCDAEHTDYSSTGFIVASNETEAMNKWKAELDEAVGWYIGESVQEITEIDGYKVIFRKGKKISLESSK